MKTKFILPAVIMAFAGTASFAQNQVQVITNPADTTIIIESDKEKTVIVEESDEGWKEITIFDKEKKKDNKSAKWTMGFDIGYNTYGSRNIFTGTDGGDDFLNLNTSKSVNVAFYPVLGSIRLTKTRLLCLESGMGVVCSNYRFEDGWTIANVDGVTVASDKYREGGESQVSKSKLTTSYGTVPLMLRLNIPVGGRYDRIYVSAGVVGGLKLSSHTKVKYSSGGAKEKDEDSFNLNLVKYDLAFRAGYENVGVYFNYQMTPMFEKNKGPKLYPYAIGVSLTL